MESDRLRVARLETAIREALRLYEGGYPHGEVLRAALKTGDDSPPCATCAAVAAFFAAWEQLQRAHGTDNATKCAQHRAEAEEAQRSFADMMSEVTTFVRELRESEAAERAAAREVVDFVRARHPNFKPDMVIVERQRRVEEGRCAHASCLELTDAEHAVCPLCSTGEALDDAGCCFHCGETLHDGDCDCATCENRRLTRYAETTTQRGILKFLGRKRT